MISLRLVEKVNLLKTMFPCSTESVDRTSQHNRDIKGAARSHHVSWFEQPSTAIDLSFDSPDMLLPAAAYARELGFMGIEVDCRNNHLHLDLRAVLWHVVIAKDSSQRTLTKALQADGVGQVLGPSVAAE